MPHSLPDQLLFQESSMCPAVNNKYKREYSESTRKKRGIKDIDKIMRRYKYYLEKIKLKSSLHRCIHMNSRKFSINRR